MTIINAVRHIQSALEAAGFQEAASDTMLLMYYIAGVDRQRLYMDGDRELESEVWEHLEQALQSRLEHVPVQYITGYQNFMGLEFCVSPEVLIPRQDTEILVEEVLKLGSSGLDILDMCTGSGCILLSILKYSHGFRGIGVDISEGALEVARKNSAELQIAAEFVRSNLFEKISKEKKFDIIVSNPPYIPSAVIPELMEEVKDHEPRLALDGSEDGLIFYKEITENAPSFLRRGGMLFFEIGFDQGEDVKNLMEKAGFQDVTVIKDLAGLDRVVSGYIS